MASRKNKLCCWMMEATVIMSPAATFVMQGPGREAQGQASKQPTWVLRQVAVRGLTQGTQAVA